MSNLVMLDLNDTLIGSHRKDGFVTMWDEWFVLDGAVEAVQSLQGAGFRTAVVTNQSAAHRFDGVSQRQMEDLMAAQMEWWAEQLLEDLSWYICWHDKQYACTCRKPGTTLLLNAMAWADAAVNRDRVWMVGDKPSDMEAGRAVGAEVIQVYKTSAPIVAEWDTSMAVAARRIILREKL